MRSRGIEDQTNEDGEYGVCVCGVLDDPRQAVSIRHKLDNCILELDTRCIFVAI